jgi:transcriptional regulator with PAS, ATPase and Fis domain
MSSTHVRLTRVLSRWVVEDNDSKNGTFLNGEPVHRAVLQDGDVIESGHTFFLYRHDVPAEGKDVGDADSSELQPEAAGLATLSPVLSARFKALTQVGRSAVSLLVQGETGTGKELVARAAHALSRRPGPFVAINCGAIPDTLVESELFGFRKGAFSGATQDRTGLIRSADHGTLFLDEIGDLPLGAQAKFLRALQEKQVVPVGATRPINVDIRVCAATHRALEPLLGKSFRQDLFARLAGFKLELPPLRARREDLGLLISALVERMAPGRLEEVAFRRRAAQALFAYDWPLNIRELEKCLETALVLARGEAMDLPHLPATVRGAARADPEEPARERIAGRDELLTLLDEHRGNLSAIARDLGKDRVQVRRWLKHHRLDPAPFRKR